ncbi:MAG: hypothetical protein AAGA65_22155 [Actinomycetota bacterium]
MRPAATFGTILAVGVLIVLIYQWSGDSIVVLILCLITLFVLLALWDRKPWQAIEEDDRTETDDRPDTEGRQATQAPAEPTGSNRGPANNDHDPGAPGHGERIADAATGETSTATDSTATDSAATDGVAGTGGITSNGVQQSGRDPSATADGRTGARPSRAGRITEDTPIWRSRFDVTVDEDGITGVALGDREPRLWPWDAVSWAGVGWSPAITKDDRVEERVGLYLGLGPADRSGPGGPAEPGVGVDRVQVMFGAYQQPGTVLGAIRRGIDAARIRRSRFHHLSHAERTRTFANALSPKPITLAKDVRSPELLYQDARRTLLTDRALRRVSREAAADQIVVAIEQLLGAHQALDLTDDEFGPLGLAADRGDVEAVYREADLVLEARGFRLAFINHGGDDHLLGLLAVDDAEEWDGQTVGSGLTVIALAPPAYD